MKPRKGGRNYEVQDDDFSRELNPLTFTIGINLMACQELKLDLI